MKIRKRLGISKSTQGRLVRVMQLILLIISVAAAFTGNFKVFVNGFVSFLITFLPSILERKYHVTMDVGLVLWITSAVFFHAVGAVDLLGTTLYTSVNWWDHFTHSLSASVVAAAGYTVLRVLDEHSDELHFPQKIFFIFILIFVISFGVLWEVLEFALAEIANHLGGEPVLIQHGVEDTMKDLMFNTAGAILVALFGEVYLNNTIEQVREHLEKLRTD